jgi:Domain of unknown function (DUF4337)
MSGHGAEPEVPHDENDPFVKKVALSVAIYAVVLVLAGAGGSNAGKDMLMGQMQASNEWNRYQAKVQREVLYMQERETLEQTHGVLSVSEVDSLSKAYQAAHKDKKLMPADPTERQKQRLGFITSKLAEYETDKAEIMKSAKEKEADRDVAHRKDPYFDFAEMFLQLGVVLASISMLSKARWPYAISLLLCVVGVFLTLNGYLLFAKVPFIDSSH